MIDLDIFGQHMGVLGDALDHPLAGPTLLMYHEALSEELTTEQFVAAATLAFRTLDRKYKTWPSPKQLIELIAPAERPALSAAEAFESVLELMTAGDKPIADRVAAVQQLGFSVLRAFRAAGGKRDFANMLESDVPWARKRFVEAYTAAVDSAIGERNATLALAAASEKVQQLVSGVAAARTLPPTRARTANDTPSPKG